MNVTFIAYWGMICAFDGILAAVRLLDYAAKLPHAMLVVHPAVLLMAVPLAYALYKDYQHALASASTFPGQVGIEVQGAWAQRLSAGGGLGTAFGRGSYGSAFNTFGGPGLRL